VDVVARCIGRVESYCPASDEGDGLRFEFSRITRGRPVIGTVKQFVRLCCEVHKAEHFLPGGAAHDRQNSSRLVTRRDGGQKMPWTKPLHRRSTMGIELVERRHSV
jgi:hypothetical protein